MLVGRSSEPGIDVSSGGIRAPHGADLSLLLRSVLVHDADLVGGGSRLEMSTPAVVRAWSAEQAIRMRAASVVVLDGRGLDARWWRRLQLAAAAAESPCLVLVVTPPAIDGGFPGGARPAATRWSVHAGRVARIGPAARDLEVDPAADPAADSTVLHATKTRVSSALNPAAWQVPAHDSVVPDSTARDSASRGIGELRQSSWEEGGDLIWTMVLRTIRAASGAGMPPCVHPHRPSQATEDLARTSVWEQLESGSLRAVIRQPRTVVGSDEWAALAASVSARARPLGDTGDGTLPLEPSTDLQRLQEGALHVA